MALAGRKRADAWRAPVLLMNDSPSDATPGPTVPPEDNERTTNPRPRRSRLRATVLGIVLGMTVGGIGGLLVLVARNRETLPMMTADEFHAAQARWKESGLKSYDLDLEVGVSSPGKTHLEVRDGTVRLMTRDGKPEPKRIWGYWSIDGLLEIIELDTERNETAARDGANRLALPIFQQAAFDPKTGIPLEYRRRESTTDAAGGWKIVSFKPR